jgi:hypothetical protein
MTHDPLADARVRGFAARRKLIERAGGLLPIGEAAARLDLTPEDVSEHRSRGTILSVPVRGEWVYPACQFTTDHGLIPGIDRFVLAMSEADPWTRLAVLLAPSHRFDGRAALDLLLAGRTGDALSIAASYGA